MALPLHLLTSCDRFETPPRTISMPQDAGVVSASGELTILGGIFENNEGERGGVWYLSDEIASIELWDGVFKDNSGNQGGVGGIAKKSTAYVYGGNYTGNRADDGGVFHVEADAVFEVRQSRGH